MQDTSYRVKALVYSAQFAPENLKQKILEESRAASWSASDPFVIVGSSIYRVRFLKESGNDDAAADESKRLHHVAQSIEHPVSRVWALSGLLCAIYDIDGLRPRLLKDFLDSARLAKSWRSSKCLKTAAILLAQAGYQDDAKRVLAEMKDNIYRRQTLAEIDLI